MNTILLFIGITLAVGFVCVLVGLLIGYQHAINKELPEIKEEYKQSIQQNEAAYKEYQEAKERLDKSAEEYVTLVNDRKEFLNSRKRKGRYYPTEE